MAARPGEVVQIDTTPLDVLAVWDDGVTGRVELTIAVDVATRTICAAVLRPAGTKAVDAALLLARMLVPEPMRPGWPQALRMSATLIPHTRLMSVDARLEHAAAKPVIMPDTIVIDHGKVFCSDAFLGLDTTHPHRTCRPHRPIRYRSRPSATSPSATRRARRRGTCTGRQHSTDDALPASTARPARESPVWSSNAWPATNTSAYATIDDCMAGTTRPARLPEICTANQRHRRLRRRHDDTTLNTALTHARNLIRDWLDADDQPDLQQRWTQRLNQLRYDPAADPYRPSHYRIELATYPEAVLLTELLASRRWRTFPMPHAEAEYLLAQQ